MSSIFNKGCVFIKQKLTEVISSRWLIPLALTLLLLIITLLENFIFSGGAAANGEGQGTALYSPPPNLLEIQEEVAVVKNLVYSESKDAQLDIYHPADVDESLPLVLWIHGGGYVGGSKDSRQDYGMALAHEGYVVANIDYALAPEQLYPGPVFQANEALAFLEEYVHLYGGDFSRVFFGGDSAGAQIASQLAAAVSNESLADDMNFEPAITADAVKGVLLMCGLYNMDTVRATGFQNIDVFLSAYTGVTPFESFAAIDQLSTVQHITEDYPPAFITVGDADPFASQSKELATALRENGVAADALFFDGTGKSLLHEYQYSLHTEEGQYALERTTGFMDRQSGE